MFQLLALVKKHSHRPLGFKRFEWRSLEQHLLYLDDLDLGDVFGGRVVGLLSSTTVPRLIQSGHPLDSFSLMKLYRLLLVKPSSMYFLVILSFKKPAVFSSVFKQKLASSVAKGAS